MTEGLVKYQVTKKAELKNERPAEKDDVALKAQFYGPEFYATWDNIKGTGSDHYKGGTVEPIDLMRDLRPHTSLTVLSIKALADCIKYATRMLNNGASVSDCNKIIHYINMVKWGEENNE